MPLRLPSNIGWNRVSLYTAGGFSRPSPGEAHVPVRDLTSWLKQWPEDPGERARYAKSIFHRVAPRYDVLTRALSFGRDARWKARLVEEARGLGDRARVLDLATGTAALPILLRQSGQRGPIVGLDLSADMLTLARRKCSGMEGVG